MVFFSHCVIAIFLAFAEIKLTILNISGKKQLHTFLPAWCYPLAIAKNNDSPLDSKHLLKLLIFSNSVEWQNLNMNQIGHTVKQ